MKILILLGAPGSGKGTQSELLVKEKQYIHISTGDLLRTISKEESDLGKKIKKVIESGELVSDQFIIEVISHKLLSLDSEAKIILDGFPRTLKQAIFLDDLLAKDKALNESKIKVITINVNNDSIIKRISGRYSCSNCNTGYHELYKKPRILNKCDNCGEGDFVKRKDDSSEIIRTRLEKYEQDTRPILEYYKKNRDYIEINGEQEINMISNDINNNI
jgi:adenylate kinase